MFSLLILTVFLLGNVAYLNAIPGNNERIVGGSTALIQNVRYQVLVLPKGHLCGGSLISPLWIVTAAHCTAGYEAKEIQFAVGVQNIQEIYNPQREVLIASQLIQHPDYNPLNKDNDIALLKSPKIIEYSSTVKKIDLMDTVPHDDSVVVVSGYGDTSFNGAISETLRSVEIQIKNFTNCYETYSRSLVKDHMICASGSYKDSCQGDSGGPLAYNGLLLGVVSFGRECAKPGYPGIYASIPYYRDWINKSTKNLS